MITHSNRIFENETILIDRQTYVGCIFKNTTIVYGGGEASFTDCEYIGAKWEFVGSAKRTMAVIRHLMIGDINADFKESLMQALGIEVKNAS